MINRLFLFFSLLLNPLIVGADSQFADYWYTGKAEINTYQLEIPRYRQPRKGKATLIYVTEDFLTERQVKKESGSVAAVSVLKLNKILDFQTGVYPYHAMQSIFSPLTSWQLKGAVYPAIRPVKTSLAMTEWCGNFYSQINTRGNQLSYLGHSYFEDEADSQKVLKLHPDGILEDNLLIRVRELTENFAPGNYKLLTSGFYARLRHQLPLWIRAKVNKVPLEKKYSVNDKLLAVNLFTITTAVRDYRIYVEQAYPRRVIAWEINYLDQGENLVEKAALIKTTRSDYWNRNAEGDQL